MHTLCHGNVRQVENLYNEGKNKIFLPDGKTFLHFAVVNPNAEVTYYLLNVRKLNPNKGNNYGIPPIFWAIKQNGTFETIRLLILFSADTGRVDMFGKNILEAMQTHGRFALVPKVQEVIEQQKQLKEAAGNNREAYLEMVQNMLANERNNKMNQSKNSSAKINNQSSTIFFKLSNLISKCSNWLISPKANKVLSQNKINTNEHEPLLPDSPGNKTNKMKTP